MLESPFIVTLFDGALCVFPTAVALAVMVVPEAMVNPVTVHVPVARVVVEPSNVTPLYTWMVVPVASTEVPDTAEIVLAVQYEPVMIGANVAPPDGDVTVTVLEAFERQFVPEMAFAVIACPVQPSL